MTGGIFLQPWKVIYVYFRRVSGVLNMKPEENMFGRTEVYQIVRGTKSLIEYFVYLVSIGGRKNHLNNKWYWFISICIEIKCYYEMDFFENA